MTTQTYVNVFEFIEKLTSKYIKVWEDICNIESPTSCKEGVDKVGQYFADMAHECGWTVETNNQKTAGSVVCITMNGDAVKKPVVFSGHMDTVHPIGLFGTPAVRISDNIIYGPGVADCKGGIAAAFLAMDALFECGYKDRPVMLLLQADEECTGMPSNKENIKYMCEKAKDAECFLNCEGYVKGGLVLERKGIMKCKVTVTGKSSHASQCWDGANAIAEAAHKIIEFEKWKDADGLTCNCGVINGGTVPNTVPDRCEFTVDIRYADAHQFRQAKEYVKSITEKSFIQGCSSTVEEIGVRPAMEYSEKNALLFERINKAFGECGIERVERRLGQGGSDAAEVTQAGIPCVDSIGVEGGCIHSPDEYAYVSSLAECAKRLAAIALFI